MILFFTCSYGQTGPYAERPGFASACEAMGGFRYVNGLTDGSPSVCFQTTKSKLKPTHQYRFDQILVWATHWLANVQHLEL